MALKKEKQMRVTLVGKLEKFAFWRSDSMVNGGVELLEELEAEGRGAGSEGMEDRVVRWDFLVG